MSKKINKKQEIFENTQDNVINQHIGKNCEKIKKQVLKRYQNTTTNFSLNELLKGNGYYKCINQEREKLINNHSYFEITKKYLIQILKYQKYNPFNLSNKENQKNINIFCKRNKLNKDVFLKEIKYFRYYTYAIIYNKIINDNSIKNKYLLENQFKKLLRNYKFISYERLIENEEPQRINYDYSLRLQDNYGNYILPRIDETFNVNPQYNLSNFLKNRKII